MVVVTSADDIPDDGQRYWLPGPGGYRQVTRQEYVAAGLDPDGPVAEQGKNTDGNDHH